MSQGKAWYTSPSAKLRVIISVTGRSSSRPTAAAMAVAERVLMRIMLVRFGIPPLPAAGFTRREFR